MSRPDRNGDILAALLNLDRADSVVGGCGTGQGCLNAAMQYPGAVFGHILDALDAWLFAQINGGNCISLTFPGMWELLDVESIADPQLKAAFCMRR